MIRKVIFAALLCGAAPLAAEDRVEMVTAHDPAGMAEAMAEAGYVVAVSEDAEGAPLLATEFSGLTSYIFFYDCEELTKQNCDSVQFSTGFDRKDPWDAAGAMEVSTTLRFAAVSLDSDGDPFITWDVVTGDGIPAKIFLESVDRFVRAVDSTADLAFADERRETSE